MPMSPYQYPQFGGPAYMPGYQPPTMQQMVSQGYQSPGLQHHVQPGITGRVVSSLDEIQVQEVPTDGTVAWFPMADGSCVYGRRWNPSGRIDTYRYMPEAVQTEPQEDPVAQLNAKVDRALEMLGSMVGEGAEDAGQH